MSPFINLPTATTLPYTYKAMPNTLPPSSSGITATDSASSASGPASSSSADPATKPKYVISASGHAAHPDDIIASCRALQAHVAKLQADADAELRALDERICARELAEKRRVAPGWLDSDARMLEPERLRDASPPAEGGQDAGGVTQPLAALSPLDTGSQGLIFGHGPGGASEMAVPDEGNELDRAFGGLGLGQK